MTNELVWCVLCCSQEAEGVDITHIFSSKESALEFLKKDERRHIFFNYIIDCPERMEQRLQ